MKCSRKRVLQFAILPPPIGGVSIHVSRLVEGARNIGINTDVFDYSKNKNFFELIKMIICAGVIHIHLSNKYFRFLIVLLLKVLKKNVVVTFHGRYFFDNIFDKMSLRLSTIPIVLNNISYYYAIAINNNVRLIGAFIPMINKDNNTLSEETLKKILFLKKKYEYIFSTNAFRVVIDDKGKEIYGGSLLFEIFMKTSNIALVFSDPTSSYKKFFINKYGSIPSNILLVTYPHQYTDVINNVDCSIRATLTDGDSLSVKESLYLNKDVICSNVVDRPKGAIIYSSKEHLSEILINFNQYKGKYLEYEYEDNIAKILYIYKSFLRE